MARSRTLFIGMDVHTDTMAVASIAQEHGTEVTSLGTMGTRQCDIDHLIRMMPSQAQHLLCVSEAGRVVSGAPVTSQKILSLPDLNALADACASGTPA